LRGNQELHFILACSGPPLGEHRVKVRSLCSQVPEVVYDIISRQKTVITSIYDGRNDKIYDLQCTSPFEQLHFELGRMVQQGHHISTRTSANGQQRYEAHKFDIDGHENMWELDEMPFKLCSYRTLLVYTPRRQDRQIYLKCMDVKPASEPRWRVLVAQDEWDSLAQFNKLRQMCMNSRVVIFSIDLFKLLVKTDSVIQIRDLTDGSVLNNISLADNYCRYLEKSSYARHTEPFLTDTHLVVEIVPGVIGVWNLLRPRALYFLPLPNTMPEIADIDHFATNADGTHLAASTMSGELIVWDLPQRKIQWHAKTKYTQIRRKETRDTMGEGFWIWYQIVDRTPFLQLRDKRGMKFEEWQRDFQSNRGIAFVSLYAPNHHFIKRIQGNGASTPAVSNTTIS
jgi:hypothetical protein